MTQINTRVKKKKEVRMVSLLFSEDCSRYRRGAGELGVIQRVSASVETKYGNDAPLRYLHTKSFYAAQVSVIFSPPAVFFTIFIFLSLSLRGFNNSVEISEPPRVAAFNPRWITCLGVKNGRTEPLYPESQQFSSSFNESTDKDTAAPST